jgi:hypothetical protein
MKYLEKFNHTLTEFIDDMILLCPDDEDYYMYKTTILASNMIDHIKICRGFHNHVSKQYGDSILDKDDSFYTNGTMIVSIDNETVVHFMSKVKSIWSGLTEANKNVVWKYLGILVILSRKVVASTS